MTTTRPRRVAVVALAGLVVAATAGCGKNDFTDRTAKVVVDGTSTTFTLDTCGLDGTTAFLVGRTDAGDVLQAVVGVEADGETGVPESTGLSVSTDDTDLEAFGDESWQRRGESGEAPGAIASARIRGSRIQASGRLVERTTVAGSTPAGSVTFSLDARCDLDEDASTPTGS